MEIVSIFLLAAQRVLRPSIPLGACFESPHQGKTDTQLSVQNHNLFFLQQQWIRFGQSLRYGGARLLVRQKIVLGSENRIDSGYGWRILACVK
jgi:hypothetical protein